MDSKETRPRSIKSLVRYLALYFELTFLNHLDLDKSKNTSKYTGKYRLRIDNKILNHCGAHLSNVDNHCLLANWHYTNCNHVHHLLSYRVV